MFKCMRCGFCCQLDVNVDEEDIKKIKKAGKQNFTIKKEGEFFLKTEGDFCIFFKEGLCSIYPVRPKVCVRFPFQKDNSISPKCQWRGDFESKIEKRLIEFTKNEAKSHEKTRNKRMD